MFAGESPLGFHEERRGPVPEPRDEGSQGAALPARLSGDTTARGTSVDTAWLRAVIRSLHDGLVIHDSEGLVLDMNQAFTDLLGYRLEDGPFRPPYPWWPTEQEDPEQLAVIRTAWDANPGSDGTEREFRFFRRDRRPLWVLCGGTTIHHEAVGGTHLRIVRDITRAHDARERRTAAAQVSQGFASVDELADLIGIAGHGFALLFDGTCTIRLAEGGDSTWFSEADTVAPEQLPQQVVEGLSGEPSPDTTRLRPGILLVAPAPDVDIRAWVQFPQPRRITVEEMIAADLLASAFAAALGRVVTVQEAADRVANLRVAVESHRLVGQATGILVERYRLLPGQAFERLRRASQHRNLKLRDLARRVIETGADPELV